MYLFPKRWRFRLLTVSKRKYPKSKLFRLRLLTLVNEKEKRIEKKAFNWELVDSIGDTTRLSDYRNDVIILDFWATWCGPCRKAMPVINTWMESDNLDGVHVFSVNIWEQTPEEAVNIMEENEYAMTLVFGNDGVADQYEIESIPYICAVDGNGIIRFEETGYSQGLSEILTWWVEDLKKKK